MDRLTEHRGKGTIIVDMGKHHESAICRLAAIEDILGDEYDLDRLRELAEADREGRCVVLPAKTVFELTWDAGPECDMACPVYIDGAGECSFCDKGKLFAYERPCKQEHIERIGEDVFLIRSEAEAALRREQEWGSTSQRRKSRIVSNLPAADVVEARHGRWMDAESDDGCTVWHCSACSCPVKTIWGYPIYRHCPMCGARMDKEDEP